MTHYTGGREFEYRIIRALKADGYETIRAAGSKGKVDIVAFKLGELLFIQAKRTDDGTILPAERAELLRLADLVDALPLVAHRDGRKLVYRELLGQGPAQWRAWSPDHGLELEEAT